MTKLAEDDVLPEGSNLSVRLSSALLAKLKRSAEDEGITVEAFATELLAEGVVLRAWEIIQRNSAMRGNAPGAAASHGGPPFRGGNHAGGNTSRPQGGGYNNHQGRPPRANNNAWMEDKAAFLEYVRNQEKRGR